MAKKIFTVVVTETRVYSVTKCVIAEDEEQAKELSLGCAADDDDDLVRELGEEEFVETTDKEVDYVDDDDADPVLTRAQLLEDWDTEAVDAFFAKLEGAD